MRVVEVRQEIEPLAVGPVQLHPRLMEKEQRVERWLRDLTGREQVVEVFLGLDVDEDLVLHGANAAWREQRNARDDQRASQKHQGFAAPGVPRSPSP